MRVTRVSRGKIELENSADRFEALGEGLVPQNRSQLEYVVYLNGLNEIGEAGEGIAVSNDRRVELIGCIRAYVAARSTVVEFE